MYIKRDLSFKLIMRLAWKNLIFFTLWALIVFSLYHFFHWDFIDLPFLPISTIGTAVAFYLGFKNNASYDRFWEARKIWGGIVNYSRTWGNQVMALVQDSASQKEMIYRHIAWINALRIQLRRRSSFSINHNSNRLIKNKLRRHRSQLSHAWEDDVHPFLNDQEFHEVTGYQNIATQLIRKQGDQLETLTSKQKIRDSYTQMEMMRSLEEFYNLQGKCERIKNTPFPRQYAYFSKVFVWIFVLLIPFGLLDVFEESFINEHEGHFTGVFEDVYVFLMIPFSVLISYIFTTMEIVGDQSEDPFEKFINDVPMTAICRTIEIDLREMLGETDLPEKTQPIDDILY
ncbi:UPF0187 protein [Flavobacteriaceae bacterium UJ101]|nr:UPF0187 protein [Flavobacteriaceae bacterium UJ101]